MHTCPVERRAADRILILFNVARAGYWIGLELTGFVINYILICLVNIFDNKFSRKAARRAKAKQEFNLGAWAWDILGSGSSGLEV